MGYNSNYNTLTLNASLLINKANIQQFRSAGNFYLTNGSMTYDSYKAYLNVITCAGTSLSSGIGGAQVTQVAISPANKTTYTGDNATIAYNYTTSSGGNIVQYSQVQKTRVRIIYKRS